MVTTIGDVEQELAESAKAFAIADSAKEQAVQDLLAVHSMWTGLARHRKEHRQSDTRADESAAESSGADVPLGSGHAIPTTAGHSASETLQRELAGFVYTSAKSKQDAATRPVRYGLEPARTYSGRVYLVFDASLTKEALESVWDAVDESAGYGAIVDTRLLSQAEGVQVTLHLHETTLDVSMFLSRLRGAEATAIADDRLRVSWSGFA